MAAIGQIVVAFRPADKMLVVGHQQEKQTAHWAFLKRFSENAQERGIIAGFSNNGNRAVRGETMIRSVSKHAVERFLAGHPNPSPSQMTKAEASILFRAKRGQEIVLPPRESTKRLLNNSFEEATYRLDNGMLFVIANGVVVTCYPYKLSKLRKKSLSTRTG